MALSKFCLYQNTTTKANDGGGHLIVNILPDCNGRRTAEPPCASINPGCTHFSNSNQQAKLWQAPLSPVQGTIRSNTWPTTVPLVLVIALIGSQKLVPGSAVNCLIIPSHLHFRFSDSQTKFNIGQNWVTTRAK